MTLLKTILAQNGPPMVPRLLSCQFSLLNYLAIKYRSEFKFNIIFDLTDR